MSKFQKHTHRAREALINLGRQHPIWPDVEQLRQAKEEMGWPDWCYLPMGGWHAIASQESNDSMQIARLTAEMAALGTWRMTQGIYRFDPALYAEIIKTPVNGDIPTDILYQIPEWCIYIESPDLKLDGLDVYGFWCHLEYDFNVKRHELRLLADTDKKLAAAVLHLNNGSLLASLESSLIESKRNAAKHGISVSDDKSTRDTLLAFLEPALSLILYVCSQQGEFTRRGAEATPTNPQPKKTKKGWKLFPVDGPLEWDVGVRIGAALRQAYQSEQSGGDGLPTGRQVRPHVRRAHWHTFVSGPRIAKDGSDIPANKRQRNLKWVPPIAVNIEQADTLPSVIRNVK